jgi:hypothetical protein
MPEAYTTSRAADDQELVRIIAFGEDIGFAFEEGSTIGSFIPGIQIGTGMRMVFDRFRLLSPGDLLHEMGHIAILPEPFRSAVHGDVGACLSAMTDNWFRENELITHDVNGVQIENPVYRALLQASEFEAQAWSYAAAIACDVDPRSVFHTKAYSGEGPIILAIMSVSVHVGITGLAAAGLCVRQSFPVLNKWLQDAEAPDAVASTQASALISP